LSEYTLSKDSKIFLVDQVIATIEIKTNYKHLKAGLENIKSVKELMTAKGQKPYQDANPPLGIIFLFKTDDTKSAIEIDKVIENMKKLINSYSINHQPDLVFSLDHAVSFRYNDIFLRDETKQEYSIFLLQGNTETHSSVWFDDDLSKTKAFYDDSQTFFFKDGEEIEHRIVKNLNDTSEIRFLSGDDFNLNPLIYRVAKINGRYYMLDKVRGFLVFVWQIENIINKKTNGEKFWSIEDYFSTHFTKSAKYPDTFLENQS
jgi:hypothetical protein